MVRFFKKFDTRVKVFTGAGFPVPFEEIYDDHDRLFEWGVIQTQDGYVISELENLIRRQVGGVMEIGQEEYENLKKKEPQKLLPGWRETVRSLDLLQILRDAARDLAAADNPKLPEVVRGMRNELQHLSRPMGTLSNWRPGVVTR